MKGGDALSQVTIGNELRVLAGHKQQIAETQGQQRLALALDFLDRQCHSQDRIVPRKAAIPAIIDALIRKIKWRKKANHFAEPLLRQLLRAPGCA